MQGFHFRHLLKPDCEPIQRTAAYLNREPVADPAAQGSSNESQTVMPGAGVEPARGCPRGILSPLRLPVPPPGRAGERKFTGVDGAGRRGCKRSGGWSRNRTGVHGFAGRCITTLPPRQGGCDTRGRRLRSDPRCPNGSAWRKRAALRHAIEAGHTGRGSGDRSGPTNQEGKASLQRS